MSHLFHSLLSLAFDFDMMFMGCCVVLVRLFHFGAHKHIILNGFGGWSNDKIIICIYVSESEPLFPNSIAIYDKFIQLDDFINIQ